MTLKSTLGVDVRIRVNVSTSECNGLMPMEASATAVQAHSPPTTPIEGRVWVPWSCVTPVTRDLLSGELARVAHLGLDCAQQKTPDFNETRCDGVTASRVQEATSSHLPSSIRTPTLFHHFLPSFSTLLLAGPNVACLVLPTLPHTHPCWTEDACPSLGGQ